MFVFSRLHSGVCAEPGRLVSADTESRGSSSHLQPTPAERPASAALARETPPSYEVRQITKRRLINLYFSKIIQYLEYSLSLSVGTVCGGRTACWRSGWICSSSSRLFRLSEGSVEAPAWWRSGVSEIFTHSGLRKRDPLRRRVGTGGRSAPRRFLSSWAWPYTAAPWSWINLCRARATGYGCFTHPSSRCLMDNTHSHTLLLMCLSKVLSTGTL